MGPERASGGHERRTAHERVLARAQGRRRGALVRRSGARGSSRGVGSSRSSSGVDVGSGGGFVVVVVVVVGVRRDRRVGEQG